MIKTQTKIQKKTLRHKLPQEIKDIQPAYTNIYPIPSKRIRTGWIRYSIAILAFIIILLVAVNKGLIFAAVVNGRPIFRSYLSKTLVNRFGKQTLDNMITVELIQEEARKQRVTAAKSDIDAKEKEILESFGGKVTLEDLLKYQGMTKEDFDEQLRVQILLSKLLGKDVTVTDAEIADFLVKNKATLQATDEAELKDEARNALINQKVSEKIQPWITDIRQKAKIMRFL